MSEFAAKIVSVIRSVLPPGPAHIALHEPVFQGNEWLYVKECIDTGWVSSAGSYVDRFEGMLRDITGAKYAVATVNGTAALHTCLVLAGVGEGHEVLVPSLSFVATANAVAYTGATPHFVDCDAASMGMDPVRLNDYLAASLEAGADGPINRHTGRIVKALVPMHTFGHPSDLDALSEICCRYGVVLIEDAAESLGSYYKGRHTGTSGLMSALSFNGNKTVTTGGGGAILTSDEALARRARHITTTAKLPHKWEFFHDEVGFNYRMPNLNAAL